MVGVLNTLGLASLSVLSNADPEDDAAVLGDAGVGIIKDGTIILNVLGRFLLKFTAKRFGR
jgi:hypothetical protein